MSESSLSLSYEDLLREVGGFLGYGVDGLRLAPEKLSEVDRYVQSGIRQFYYPPAAQGIEAGYAWSFMKPSAQLVTVKDQETNDLPDDFGNMVGMALYFPDTNHSAPIALVSVGQIMAKKSVTNDSGIPCAACVRFKESDGTSGQRSEIVWWKTPDGVYTLDFTYHAYAGKLTEDYPYPLGGMRFSEVITESCLAIAEQRANDEKGLHSETFLTLLASAIEIDRKSSAKYYGQMGGAEIQDRHSRRNWGSTYPVTYKGETW
jgi:hypothetical protein